MIQTILFSFDRASQLSCLLESIEKFDNDKTLCLSVLFGYSSEDYKKGYEILQKKYPMIVWLEEKRKSDPPLNFDFNVFNLRNLYWWNKYPVLKRNKSDFKQLLIKNLEDSPEEYIMMLTDDSQFISKINITESKLKSLLQKPSNHSFSLRHGRKQIGGLFLEKEGLIQWDIFNNDPQTDWGYPFSVDGHIYSKSILLPLLKGALFNSPNTLELFTALRVKRKHLFSTVFAFDENSLIGFELNRVQQFASNNHLNISPELLNNYFLEGYSLKILYDQSKVVHFRPEITRIFAQKGEDIIFIYDKNRPSNDQ